MEEKIGFSLDVLWEKDSFYLQQNNVTRITNVFN